MARSTRPRRVAAVATFGAVMVAGLSAFGGMGYALDAVRSLRPGGATSSQFEYPTASCVESVNPHGKTIPPAGGTLPGPKGGQNPDGFYQIGSSDGSDVVVVDMATGTVFGPYPAGTVIKYTEANGTTPHTDTIGSSNGQAGAVTVHIWGQGDAAVRTVAGTQTASCLVPPKPK